MKILIISEYFSDGKSMRFSGGVETRNLYIAKNLSRNHSVTIITSRLNGTKKQEKLFGANIIRVGRGKSYNPTAGSIFQRMSFVYQAILAAKKVDFDVIEGTNFITHYIALKAGRSRKKPVIFWYPDVWLGSWMQNAGIFGILGELLERFNLWLGADRYIAISNATAVKLKKYIGRNVHVIPCGVDMAEFKGKKIKSEGPLKIICISRLASYKKVKDLVLAYGLLTKKIPNVRLLIVGQGPQEQNIRRLVSNLKIKGVDMLQNLPRKDLVNALKKSYLFCLPSAVEGFGISVIEAASCGVPYVVSNIPVFKEVTKNGMGGLLFEVNNINQLENSLFRMISERSLYQDKKKELLTLAKKYKWEYIAQRTEMVYKSAL